MKKDKGYIPDRGDIIWLTFDPTLAHEQAGRRPAVVLTPKLYNSKTSLCIACPITSKVKGYPFEITCSVSDVSAGKNRPKQILSGVILADQLRSVSWKERKAQKIGAIPEADMRRLQKMIQTLLEY